MAQLRGLLRRAAEILISDLFPASAISEISRFFFADTRNLWCTGLYWSTATAAGATYTVLDCTRRSAVLMRARAPPYQQSQSGVFARLDCVNPQCRPVRAAQ